MTEDHLKDIGWSKSKPLLHLVTAARLDDLNLPIVEGLYGDESSLYGWVVSEDTHLPLNIQTRKFKEWYESTTGGTLIDHEIAPAYYTMADEAVRIYDYCKEKGNCGRDDKERILYAIRKLEIIAQLVQSEYEGKAGQLTSEISAASARENEDHQRCYQKHIADLTQKVLRDLDDYNREYRERSGL